MTGTEQPTQVLLPTKIGGSIKLLVGIANSFKTNKVNRMDLTIRPTIVHSNQLTIPGHSDQDYFLLGSLDSGTDAPISGPNIDNRTRMNPHGPIVTTILESNSASNCNIFDSFRGKSDLAYRGSPWHGAAKSESKNFGGNKTFENSECENNYEVGNFGTKI